MSRESSHRTLWGVLAALTAVVLWAAWIVGTRHGAVQLDVAAISLLRFGIPALALLPVLLRKGLMPGSLAPLPFAAMVLGGGIGFFFFAAYGLRIAQAAEAGPLMPGTMPLFVALLSTIVLGERLGRRQVLGFVLIAIGGVAIIGYRVLSTGSLSLGHPLVMSAAFSYAVFTVLFRRSGMTGIEAAAVVGFWSTLVVLPFAAVPFFAAIREGMTQELFLQGAIQGIASGLLAMIFFGIAVTRLGAPRAAAFSALIPGMVALLGIPFLGEWPGAVTWAGIAIVSAGVALANWPSRR